ncbi:hypothetical protein A3C98_02110 [Candidatus Roizmanbacteria bacterium RIFCSPHIGHO2_02_FULL_37_15]|uniref:Uncharacterized protein n=1 Tax=Candidatus Roizmanbacteria bacterium RIFCSPLOWO2_01_FULL_37_16 TaxID=1802058 RepID=A0A1F7IQ70_9BACT|nr:MAG: hypothetical protein A2859_04470 [Candidatus Roizmanbacteria bacterium RIFCSPHIGHO2_01_FULL_37_16b]OGK21188.1 MAG: hypothetical protein A3C98_02110 [Candidatus Roizmanbacteria bacterium RIFCSPHIGHO2_02_FULL_37_15]OGK32871.1 MAG: hypothetical protein A3F57_01965 [Candidatus Roizmanbacteria bacterium RIFCSPHIGHO2_12_FULL_36_11]OGK45511.1 MAG: hypothetical protein A3B40_00650 [Candidatus Roizmanbacteria bacterium RIFCSPLOWO2_01_FULL_37_16]OGK55715.1 MAG: hypothetical protein A3I50_02545 [C
MKYLVVHIRKEIKKNLFDYLLLFTAGVLFLISLNIFKGERLLEFIILLIFISFYIIWGIYHHIIEDSLHLKTVVEYILIAFTLMFLLKIIILPG